MKLRSISYRDVFPIRYYLRTLKRANLMSQSNKSTTVSVNLNETVYDDFQAFCRQYQCSESEATEIAIKFLLDKLQCHYANKSDASTNSQEVTSEGEQSSEGAKRLSELVDLLHDQLEAMDQLLVLKKNTPSQKKLN
jgi:hypothetical protein